MPPGCASPRGTQTIHAAPTESGVRLWPGAPSGLTGGSVNAKEFSPMAVISMKALLETGVHFGHRTRKWHPKMKPYIFTERNGIHIIDLQQTLGAIDSCYNHVRDTAAKGGTILFVGTKRQAQEAVANEAERCGMPHVTNRWLGGMITHWRTLKERIDELKRLEKSRDTGEFELLTKKEGLILGRKIEKLQEQLGGIDRK